jgi:hypothetical protein
MRPSAFADIIFLPEFCFVLKCYAEDFLETRARELRRRPAANVGVSDFLNSAARGLIHATDVKGRLKELYDRIAETRAFTILAESKPSSNEMCCAMSEHSKAILAWSK